ncbi:MAG: PEGA domain-containing protein [Gammaproteobacteria bacterium]|nr:PEGA domain-containing protein [Gammaproteobacteria bacterium]
MSEIIRPIAYSAPPPPGRRVLRGVKPSLLLIAAALALLAVVVAYVFTARAVRIDIGPTADSYAISGGLLNLKLGERHLLRPGTYVLRAEREGYKPLKQEFVVERSGNQTITFSLEKLPGLVSFVSEPVADASVFVDGQRIGTTPLTDYELPPGTRRVSIEADRYRTFETDFEVQGENTRQVVETELEPAWALIAVSSEPEGAEIRIDGELRASTPAQIEILEGSRMLEVSLPGHKTVERSVQVAAGENQTLPTVALAKSDGRVALESEPTGANVTVAGVYRGQTPLALALPPGKNYEVQFTRAGFRKSVRNVTVRSGEGRTVAVKLEPEEGVINLSVSPRESRVFVDGKLVGKGAQTLTLTAVVHQLRVELEGFAPYSAEITPRPGFRQEVAVTLKTLEEARYDALPLTIRTAAGQSMNLVRPGSLRMGASRREPGRRANEVMRQVTLTRPFYIGTTEVSNEQFALFDSGHESGIVGRSTLNLVKAPVVKVSWEQAARFCNWLSLRDGLEPAYAERDGGLALKRPVGTGYRLPTEVEWVWAARGDSRSKYPWGQTMPPPATAGNFADDTARPLVAKVIAGLNDGYAATAPVASFAANERGLYDFAGNVAEWVHDFYAVNPSPGGAPETDPVGPAEGDFHVLRGSSWKHSTITELRWSFRDYAAEPRNDVGFRIARYAD